MENEQIKQKFPIGMILILIHVGWGAISLSSGIFKIPLSHLGPVIVTGVGAIIVNLVILGILATIFYGIIKRLKWAKKLAIGWYIFSMVLIVVNLVSFLGNKTMYYGYFSLMIPAIITGSLVSALRFGFVIGLIVIIYLVRKKDFFVN